MGGDHGQTLASTLSLMVQGHILIVRTTKTAFDKYFHTLLVVISYRTYISSLKSYSTVVRYFHFLFSHRCAENGDIDTLVALMNCGHTPPNSFPVVTAFAGRKPCLEYCIDSLKMAVDSKDMYDRTPLHRAVEGSKYDIAK